MAKKIYSCFDRPEKVKGIEFTEPSQTWQEFQAESDINNIVDVNMRYKDPAYMTKLQMSGKVSHAKPVYGDFTSVVDYQTALNTVDKAQKMFMSLPSKIRDKFDNDPAQLVEFVNHKDENYDLGLSLGIYKPKNNDVIEQNPNGQAQNASVEPISGSSPETSAQPLT